MPRWRVCFYNQVQISDTKIDCKSIIGIIEKHDQITNKVINPIQRELKLAFRQSQ